MVKFHQITILHGLWHETLNLAVGSNDLTLGSGWVVGQVTQLLNLFHRAVSHGIVLGIGLGVGLGSLGLLLLAELLVLLFDELLIGSAGLVGQTQTFAQLLALFLAIAIEGMEVFLVVFEDDLVQDCFLYLGIFLLTFVNQENQALDEVLLLIEVLVILLFRDLEGIHGDRMFLGIGDIDASCNLTEHLITVTDINNDYIRQLLEELAHDSIHEEALTASTGAKDKVVTVVGHLLGTFLTREVQTDGNTLTVCVPELQGSHLTFLLTLLIHHAEGCIAERQETVIVRTELATVTGETGNEQFKLVVGTLGNLDVHLTEEVLQIVRDPGHAGIL